MAEPRGVRNNNPGNLVKTDATWLGEIAGDDPRFSTFEKPEYGVRAMGKQLALYQQRDGLRTIEQIVGRWAPAEENEATRTGAYQAAVAKALGVSATEPVDLSDSITMQKLVEAMVTVENGPKHPFTPEVIKAGLDLMPLSKLQDQSTSNGMEVPALRAKMDQNYTQTHDALWSNLQSMRAQVRPIPQPTLTPASAADIRARVELQNVAPSAAQQVAREAEQHWAAGVDFLDKVAASWDETSLPALRRQQLAPPRILDNSFNADAAYSTVSDQVTDPDDVVALLSAGNQARFDWELQEINRRRDNARVMGTGSMLGSLGAGLVAGAADPMTWVTGAAGMKAAALLGRTGYMMYAAGGALGNVSYDAVRAAAGADVTGTDVVAGAFLGAGLGALGYRFGGAADDAAARTWHESMKAVQQERAKVLDAAATELGPTATAEQVSRRADEMTMERLFKNMDIVLAKPDAGKELIPPAPPPDVRPVDPSLPGPGQAPQLTATGITPVAPEVLGPEPGALARLREVGERVRQFITGEPPRDPDGLDYIPDPGVRESVRRILHHAAEGVALNPVDETRLRVLSDALSNAAPFRWTRENIGSAAIQLLRSESPVAKWWAMQALENTTGAYRTSTVSITKYQLEHMYMGDVKNEMELLFDAWRREQGLPFKASELFTQEQRRRFDDEIFRYREGVRNGIRVVPAGESKLIKQASDLLTRSYDMMRRHQQRARVSGFGNLPTSSEGYQPWAISPRKWRALSDAKKGAYIRALSEEVQAKHGWDKEFSDFFARQYVDQVNKWVNGGVHASVLPNESAVDVLANALKARGLSQGEILKRLDEFTKGGRKQTKGRLDRDMLTPYDDGEGGYMSLSDIMETDAVALLQRQARRVSGEVALANWGVTSDAELQLIRTAMEHSKATPQELESFDQTVAELLGRPYGESAPVFFDNLRAASSLVQLGGMAFAQLAELGNAVASFGVTALLRKVPDFARISREIRTMAKGGTVDNPLLAGADEFFGNIGMHHYRNTFAHQMGDPGEVAFGRDSIGTIGRLLRGGQYLQGKFSLWRHVQAVQQRAVAEMAINKGLTYVRDGLDTAALRDMGISPELQARIKAELPNIATFDANGRVMTYDPQRGVDTGAIRDFNQAIIRGVSQIVQDTFVGETGKWAHNGYLRLLTQFRTYSITAFEKQFVRQYRTHGALKAAGILLAGISVSAPIYMLRTALNAALLPADKRDEYLDTRLDPLSVGIAGLGYTAQAGFARDLMDMGGSFLGFDVPGSPRVPSGNIVASTVPGLSLIEDLRDATSRAVQKGDLSGTLRVVPGGRLPFVAPALQAILQSDD